MLTNLACPSSRYRGEWDYTTVHRSHQRQTRSHGTDGWKDASENNKWIIVQCATFSRSLNPRIIDKSVSDIRIRILFPFESSFCHIRIRLQTHYLAGYPTGKPDSDHLWYLQRKHDLTWLMRWFEFFLNFMFLASNDKVGLETVLPLVGIRLLLGVGKPYGKIAIL